MRDTSLAARLELLRESSRVLPLPSGKTLRVVDDEAIVRLAGLYESASPAAPQAADPATAKREAELTALRAGICPRRYLRNIGVLGLQGQIRLLQTKAGLAGLGGLGGFVAEILARAGIGELILVDPDQTSEENLNRQLLVTEDTLGWDKVEAARERLQRVNSAVSLVTHRLAGDAASFGHVFAGAKIVIDALDSLPARYELQEAARLLGTPMVHGAIGGLSGQVTTIFPGDPGLSAVYGPRGSAGPHGVEALVGNPSATPAMIAALQAQEVIKLATGVGQPLRGKLLILDAMSPYAAIIDL
jgi:molybdopterin/thiamine biosynthesis adenylyltransferase